MHSISVSCEDTKTCHRSPRSAGVKVSRPISLVRRQGQQARKVSRPAFSFFRFVLDLVCIHHGLSLHIFLVFVFVVVIVVGASSSSFCRCRCRHRRCRFLNRRHCCLRGVVLLSSLSSSSQLLSLLLSSLSSWSSLSSLVPFRCFRLRRYSRVIAVAVVVAVVIIGIVDHAVVVVLVLRSADVFGT